MEYSVVNWCCVMLLLLAVLEKKMTARQGRDELIKKGLLEMMEQGK